MYIILLFYLTVLTFDLRFRLIGYCNSLTLPNFSLHKLTNAFIRFFFSFQTSHFHLHTISFPLKLHEPHAFAFFIWHLFPRLDQAEVDQIYQVLKQASDLSSKPSNSNRNLLPNDSYQNQMTNALPPRSEFYLEKTASFSKNDYYYPKHQKSYSRAEYQTTPDFYQTDFYQQSPPKTYKNRLSDPGVIHMNNAACFGPPAAGTATSGSSCVESASQPRRQQGPLLLRGSTTYSVGPVPIASSSGTYYSLYMS